MSRLKYSCFCVLFLVLTNCTRNYDSEFLQLKKEIKETYNVHLPDDTKCIFIINDNYCSTCVSIFSQFVLTKLNNPKNVLCFVNSTGVNVDLNSFRAKRNKNIHISTHVLQPSNTLVPSRLGAVFLKDAEIDTIVYIETNRIAEQLDFINTKIKLDTISKK